MTGKTDLHLNRKLSNHSFSSWKLSSEVFKGQHVQDLPGSPLAADAPGPDYVHTREALLHNGIYDSCGRLFIPVSRDGRVFISEVTVDATTEGAHAKLQLLCELALQEGGSIEGQSTLHSSLASVQAAEGTQLLISTGKGDLQLVQTSASTTEVSNVIHPMHMETSTSTPTAFVIEAAHHTSNGHIRCIAWSLHSSSSHHPGVCHIHSILLAVRRCAEPGARPLEIAVADAQLLQRSALPPFVVVASPSTDCVLLGVDPDMPLHEGQDHTQGAEASVDDMEDAGDVDPRTLEQAAERLAKYTTEGTSKSERVADLYKETDATEEDQEPRCELQLFRCSTQAAQAGQLLWSMTCEAHRLLAAQHAAGAQQACLLGLTDDVDCAVVRAKIGDEPGTVEVSHVGSIPAMAYVVAGKVQRKHFLLGTPNSQLACVLVENHKYCYLYKSMGARDEFGEQQVVDMGLAEGETVLGARLLPVTGISGEVVAHLVLILTPQRLITIHTV